jgi:uncharacterized spore protein YtfJ
MQVEQMMSGVRDALTVKRVFGDPIEREGATVIPAALVRGGGGGGGEEKAGGGGFGLTARPVGAYIVKGGGVRYRPAIDVNRIILGGQIVLALALLTLPSVLRYQAKAAPRRRAPLPRLFRRFTA